MSTRHAFPALPGVPSHASAMHAVLAAIRSAAPDLPLDPVLLHALLLSLVAPHGSQNLLLRVKDADVPFVQNLTALILLSVFAYPTQKVRSRSKQSSSELLCSLFLHCKSSSKGRSKARSRNLPRSSSEPSQHSFPTLDDKEIARHRPRLHTDSESSSSSPGTAADQMVLPKAIVVSGLEHSAPAQRALLQVLAEQRVVLEDDLDAVYTLPKDFMVIYVCSVDPRERPKIHTALLDRFAMSVNMSPTAAIRQAYASFSFSSGLQTPSLGSSPIISSDDIAYLRSLPVHFHPSLTMYMNDLFTVARHHHELDGTLLTSRAHKDAEALIRAHRLLSGDSTSTALIRYASAQAIPDDLSDDSRTKADEVHSDERVSDKDRGKNISRDELHDLDEHGRSFLTQLHERDSRMDVSEIDVARIVPRVISHRLRVRDGPDHEIFSSLLYPAVSSGPLKVEQSQRKTVKDIIVEILADT